MIDISKTYRLQGFPDSQVAITGLSDLTEKIIGEATTNPGCAPFLIAWNSEGNYPHNSTGDYDLLEIHRKQYRAIEENGVATSWYDSPDYLKGFIFECTVNERGQRNDVKPYYGELKGVIGDWRLVPLNRVSGKLLWVSPDNKSGVKAGDVITTSPIVLLNSHYNRLVTKNSVYGLNK